MREPIGLIEDDPDDEELVRSALSRAGYASALIARDGAEAVAAIERLAAQGALPKLVLLDLKLPKLDGFDVLRRLRQEPRTRRVPIVMFSTSSDARDVARSYELGANGYVRKPVAFEELRERLAKVARYWVDLNISL